MRKLIVGLVFAIRLFGAAATYDGAKVHYESYGEGADALVFIHGWTCDLTFWSGQAPVYQKHRSILIDLPGHGQSDKPDVPYTQERFARAVDAVLRDAKVEHAVLIGHSMGGPVALTFLRLFPAKVRGLVLVDAYLQPALKDEAARAAQKKQTDDMVKQWLGPGYKDLAKPMVESMFSDRTTPAQREKIRTKMMNTPQTVMASAFQHMLLMDGLRPDEKYGVPVAAIMVKRGARSDGYEATLRAHFPDLRKYEAWEGAGHFLMMESPERFNQALEGFLATLK